MKAVYDRPTGFRDPSAFSEPVTIVGYCYGEDEDANGYDRRGKAVLAIFIRKDGRLGSAPISHLEVPALTESQEQT